MAEGQRELSTLAADSKASTHSKLLEETFAFMPQQRWVRIIPVATVMYAIAFINRTNVSLALPAMSHDLGMNNVQAGSIVGIFFLGYLLLQIPGGYLASHWSTKRFVS